MRRLGPRVFFLVFFAYTLTVSIFIQVPFMFYNDEEGLDAARKESGLNDASGVVWAHRYVFKCFYFLFIFIFYYYDTQCLPHPPRLQLRVGDGHFHCSDPTPPSSLTCTSRGWVLHHPPSQTHSSQHKPTKGPLSHLLLGVNAPYPAFTHHH